MSQLKPWIILICGLAFAGCARRPNPERPNIVVILADDFGVGDIQAHYPDNKIPTPYLDRFVSEGMSFTDAHSGSAVCTPTRYGLLTGRYAWRTRLQEWVLATYEPPLIAEGRPTLPGLLRKDGYQTACIGKWHLGWNWPGPQPSRMEEVRNGLRDLTWDFAGQINDGPTARGFDYYFGGDVPNLPPFTWIENDRVTIQPTESFPHAEFGKIYMPRSFDGLPMAPGWQFDEILPELTRRAVNHIHEKAKEEDPFFLFFSMTSPHEPVSPSDPFKGKSGIAPIADFVMETDWSAGQIIKAIDEAGIADDTLIIFTADNGHSHYTGWKELTDAGHQPSGPYRGHKGDIWEGGHRVPFIARWPGKIEEGAVNSQLLCLTDVFATCAELVGRELPNDGAEDSVSLLPQLLARPTNNRRTSFVSHSNFGEFAYRDGPWKLIFKNPAGKLDESRGKPRTAELYHLDDDIAEAKNLAEAQPEIAARMTADLRELVERGATREDVDSQNDTRVRFEAVQTARWTAALEGGEVD